MRLSMADTIIATNKQARYNYTILESLEAGIELKGTEVKSLRNAKASLQDSFARPERGEIFVYNMHIAPYEFGNIANPDPARARRLLLHKRQIRHLSGELAVKKLTLIPLKLYIKNGIIKMELALAKGKKLYDKRQAIRRREEDREIRKAMKDRK